jgi:hypothetical protein
MRPICLLSRALLFYVNFGLIFAHWPQWAGSRNSNLIPIGKNQTKSGKIRKNILSLGRL